MIIAAAIPVLVSSVGMVWAIIPKPVCAKSVPLNIVRLAIVARVTAILVNMVTFLKREHVFLLPKVAVRATLPIGVILALNVLKVVRNVNLTNLLTLNPALLVQADIH